MKRFRLLPALLALIQSALLAHAAASDPADEKRREEIPLGGDFKPLDLIRDLG